MESEEGMWSTEIDRYMSVVRLPNWRSNLTYRCRSKVLGRSSLLGKCSLVGRNCCILRSPFVGIHIDQYARGYNVYNNSLTRNAPPPPARRTQSPTASLRCHIQFTFKPLPQFPVMNKINLFPLSFIPGGGSRNQQPAARRANLTIKSQCCRQGCRSISPPFP